MSTDNRADIDPADLHRMATKIALSYARCHNETIDAFPNLFRTAYQGLLSCTEAGQSANGAPSKSAGAKGLNARGAGKKLNGHAKAPATAAAHRNGKATNGYARTAQPNGSARRYR